jgi:Tol biopolymer transport system component
VSPIWSPDGARIVWSARRKGDVRDLYLKGVRGSEASGEALLLESPQNKLATDWSPDGRTLLFITTDPETGMDLWALPKEGHRTPVPVVVTPSAERWAQFSPDGKWIAYESDKSGRFELYLRPYPGPGREVQVSTAGGTAPRWGLLNWRPPAK